MNKIYFYKKVKGYNHEATHVYEHIFLNAFRKHAKENGFTEGLYGWVHGSVYYGAIILLEGCFYGSKAEKLFRNFLAKEIKISDEDIKKGITAMSAEYLSNIEITDKKAFYLDIEKVSKSPFSSLDKNLVIEKFEIKDWEDNPKIAKVNKGEDLFKKITVNFDYTGKNLEEMAIIFRLWPILADNIKYIVYTMGGYVSEILFPEFMKDSDYLNMGIVANFRKENGLENKIEAEIKNMQDKMVFTNMERELKTYINSYRDDSSFADDPEAIMDDAGILISRDKMAELFTPENVQHVWGSLDLNL